MGDEQHAWSDSDFEPSTTLSRASEGPREPPPFRALPNRRGPRYSGTLEVVAEVGSGRAGLIVDALSVVLEVLRSASPSARTRELLAQAKSYERAVKSWATVAPSETQLDLMFELVEALREKSVASVEERGESW